LNERSNIAITAILFDIDGTLLDSVEFLYRAFEHAFDLHHIPRMPREGMREFIGPPLEKVYVNMAPGCDAASMTESHRQFQETHLDLIKLFPDTISTLEELKRRNLKLAAITTRSKRTSIESLERFDLTSFFEIIVSAEDVQRHKPDPEPLQKALSAMSVIPTNAIMVGDTEADILAGKNAGTKTAAALYGFGGRELIVQHPHYILQRLGEILQVVERSEIIE
jgi:pyrophosphatase PpaX